jgi:hypothetical protein
MSAQTTSFSDLKVPHSNDYSMFIHSTEYLLGLLGAELYQNLSDLYHFTTFIDYYVTIWNITTNRFIIHTIIS